MATGYYGLDHPNKHGIKNKDGQYHGYMARKQQVRIIVIHTPEVLPDYNGVDDSAESVSKYFSTTDRSASAHVNIDRDSTVPWLPPDHVAFHVRNYNSIGYGAEIGYRATEWGKRPDVDEQIISRVAAHLAPIATKYGIPVKFVTKAEVDKGAYGFTSHAQLDPTRRTDPGTKFPWANLFAAITLEQLMDSLTKEEIAFLKDMIKGVLALDSNADFAKSLIEFKRKAQSEGVGVGV